jgi:hypothetical protein
MSKYGVVPSSSIEVRVADKIHAKERYEFEKKVKDEERKQNSKIELYNYYKNVIEKIDIQDVISTMIAYNYTSYTINSETISSHLFDKYDYKTWDREYFITTSLHDLNPDDRETQSFYQLLMNSIPVEYRDEYIIHYSYDGNGKRFNITMDKKWLDGHVDSYYIRKFLYYACFCCTCCCVDSCGLPYEFVR